MPKALKRPQLLSDGIIVIQPPVMYDLQRVAILVLTPSQSHLPAASV